MSQFELIDETGASRFRGSQRPPGGGSQPSEYAFGKTVCTFDETAGAGTYTATVPIIAGGRILEVVAFVLAGPWSADTAALNAGDTAQPTGYLNGASALCDLVSNLNTPFDPLAVTSPDSWLDPQLQAAGDVPNAPAYKDAAHFYFSNNAYLPGVPYPNGDDIVITVVAAGAYDTGPIAASTLGDWGGSGYAPGDTGTLSSGNNDATYVVDTVGTRGNVLTFHLDAPGTGYSTGTSGTSPSTGGGDGNFTTDVTAVGGGGSVTTAILNPPGGSGYAPGDTGTIVGGGNSDAAYVVDTVNGNGSVLTYHLSDDGTGYATGIDFTGTDTGAGDGYFTVDVTAITPAANGRLVVDVIGFGLTPETIAAVKS